MHYFYSLIQKIIEFLGRNNHGISVLMFHQVNDNVSLWKDENVSIKAETFKLFIDSLIAKGFTFISVDEIDNHLNNKAIVITFDDVFYDAVENAIPYLTDLKIPFCVFISDCFIDKPDYITSEQLKIISKNPICTVGYHSKSHGMFRKMSSRQLSYVELNSERLENLISSKVNYFAFPYGSVYACGFRKAKVAKTHFRYSFSTLAVKCTRLWLKYYPYYLPRINVNEANNKRILTKQ